MENDNAAIGLDVVPEAETKNDTVVTASGRTFETDLVSTIPSPPYAYIRILNSDLATVASVFGNPEETKEIRYNELVLTGYHFTALVMEGTAIRVNLSR